MISKRRRLQRDVAPDYVRQRDLFSPGRFAAPITVIGAGATGSYATWILAKMGCRDITIYDPDVVERRNLPNQLYGPAVVGEQKVQALREMVHAGTATAIRVRPERFAGGALSGMVFLCVDTMAARRRIWERSVRGRRGVRLLVDIRMAAEGGLVYAVRPTVRREIAGYERTLHTDADAEPNPCTRRAIAPSVAVLAGVAAFTMLEYVSGRGVAGGKLLVSLRPFLTEFKAF